MCTSLFLFGMVSGFRPLSAEKKEIGLRISPLRSYPSQYPGSTSTGSIKLANITGSSQHISLSAERFLVVNEDYDYRFDQDSSASWIRIVDKEIKLIDGETKEIAYSLAVPANASPGGYYLALIASSKETTSSTELTVIKRVAAMIYLEVGGKLVKKAELITFDAPWLSTKNNIPLEFRLSNSGNTHMRARVAISYKMLPFGKPVAVSSAEALILPSSIRKIDNALKLPRLPGLYRVSSTFAPPQGGIINKNRYVLFVPFWLVIILIIVAILVLVIRPVHRRTDRSKTEHLPAG